MRDISSMQHVSHIPVYFARPVTGNVALLITGHRNRSTIQQLRFRFQPFVPCVSLCQHDTLFYVRRAHQTRWQTGCLLISPTTSPAASERVVGGFLEEAA